MLQNNKRKAVILTIHSDVYKAVHAYLSEQQEEITSQGTIYEQGIFLTMEISWDIFLAQIGEGNVESAIEAERAIQRFRPEVILSIGLAHGFKDVQVGDVVAATKVYGYEYGKDAGRSLQTRPEIGKSTHGMIHRARAEARVEDWKRFLPQARNEYREANVFVGPLAAGEKEIGSSSMFWHLLENHYNDTLAMDTNSSGFLGATHSNSRIEALIVRGIISTFSVPSTAESIRTAASYVSAFAFAVLSKLSINQLAQSEMPQADPLLLLEQLAYGNIPSISAPSNRNMTLHSATTTEGNLLSLPAKKAWDWFEQGNQYFQQQSYKEAIKFYNRAFRLNKKDPRICNNKGIALFHLEDYVGALEAYESAINCDPHYADAYSNKAAVHYKLGDYTEAQASYQHAIDLYNRELA